jgi:predicted  nucleic acid-binding Zn-ribbon protein
MTGPESFVRYEGFWPWQDQGLVTCEADLCDACNMHVYSQAEPI